MKIIHTLFPVALLPLFTACASASPDEQNEPEDVAEATQALTADPCATGKTPNTTLSILNTGDDQQYERAFNYPNAICMPNARPETIVNFDVTPYDSRYQDGYISYAFTASDPRPPADALSCGLEQIDVSFWRGTGTGTWIKLPGVPNGQASGLWTPKKGATNPLTQGTCTVQAIYAASNGAMTSKYRVNAKITRSDGTSASVLVDGRNMGLTGPHSP